MKGITQTLLFLITIFHWVPAQSQESSAMKAIDKDSLARLNKEYTSEGAPSKKRNPALDISFSFDKADAIYKVGEPATYTVKILHPDQTLYNGICQFRLTDENSETIKEGNLDVKNGQAQYTATYQHPGFIRLYITASADGLTETDYATVAFDPQKIKASQVFPADFMDFWKKEKYALDQIPMDLHRVEFVGPNPDFKYEYIDFQNVDGKRFYFMMSQPKKPGKYKVSMRIPGAGIYKRHVKIADAPNTISIELSVHDFPINQPIKTYEKIIPNYFRVINGKKVRYEMFNIQDREKYYYKSVILGLWRTLDIACALPNVDLNKVMVSGGSQGGGLTLAIAGLDQRIKYIEVQCPVFCDHTAAIKQPGREAGWPRVLEHVEKPEWMDDAIRTTAYYDNCNFARFIKAPVFLAQGFNDKTVPSSGTYAMFSLINSPKEMYVEPFSAHGFTAEAQKQIAIRSAAFRKRYFGDFDKKDSWLEGGDKEN